MREQVTILCHTRVSGVRAACHHWKALQIKTLYRVQCLSQVVCDGSFFHRLARAKVGGGFVSDVNFLFAAVLGVDPTHAPFTECSSRGRQRCRPGDFEPNDRGRVGSGPVKSNSRSISDWLTTSSDDLRVRERRVGGFSMRARSSTGPSTDSTAARGSACSPASTSTTVRCRDPARRR